MWVKFVVLVFTDIVLILTNMLLSFYSVSWPPF
uniref:Uncharacterized protein n=1 Tax=Rhizophora mucronata TaxID=61149 RepID=A0A2P2NRC7_RHIMU